MGMTDLETEVQNRAPAGAFWLALMKGVRGGRESRLIRRRTEGSDEAPGNALEAR
jgi:hypothetical protein